MIKKNYFIMFFALLLLLPFVSANYNSVTTFGNDNGLTHDIFGVVSNGAYVGVGAVSSGEGSNVQPVVYDYNVDGVADLILPVEDGVTLVEGKTLNVESDRLYFGNISVSPVVCDVNGDGKKEYVGVFNINNTVWNMVVLTVVDSRLVVVANKTISTKYNDSPNVAGNLICDNFYVNHGDSKNYIFYVTNDKQLRGFSLSGSTIVNSVWMNVSNSNLHAFYYNSYNDSNSYSLVNDNTFDRDGRHALFFVAGHQLVGLFDDGDERIVDWASFHPAFNMPSVVLMGGVKTGSPTTSLLLSDNNKNGNGYTNIVLYDQASTFGYYFMHTRAFVNIPYKSLGGVAVSDVTGDGIDELFYISSDTSGRSYVINSNNMTIRNEIYLSFPDGTPFNVLKNININPFVVDKDIVTGSNWDFNVYKCSWASNYTSCSSLGSRAGSVSTTTPLPVDINADGILDFVSSSNDSTSFLMSTAGTVITKILFNVSYNKSDITNNQLVTYQNVNVTTGYDDLYYSIACNVVSNVTFSERYVPSIFSVPSFVNNISIFTDNLQGNNLSLYIKSDGLLIDIPNNNMTYFDFVKNLGQEISGNLRYAFFYQNSGNSSEDIIFRDFNGNTMFYMIVEKNDTNVTFYKYSNGIKNKIGSAITTTPSTLGTLRSNQVFIDMIFTPQNQLINNIRHYNIKLKMNYNVVVGGNTNSNEFSTEKVSSIEIYTESNGTTKYLTQSMELSPDLEPSMIHLTKGYPSNTLINGEGFDIITGDTISNFTAICYYPFGVATYGQIHYLSNIDNDYTNYVYSAVFATDVSKDTGLSNPNAPNNIDNLKTNANSNPISKYFYSLGIDGVSALLLGLFISIVLAGIFMVVAYKTMRADGMLLAIVGVLVFVSSLIGTWAIGLTPVWVIILLVIICASLVALAFRYAVSGA